MTKPEQEMLARKAVRVRNLTDPLGTMGFRKTGERVRHESRLRVKAFAATGLCFAAILGAMFNADPNGTTDTASANRTVQSTDQGAAAAIHIVPPRTGGVDAAEPISRQPVHTRTRGS